MSVTDDLNTALRAGERRALALEDGLAGLLEPVLRRAGREAATRFQRYATRLDAGGLTAAGAGVTEASTMVALRPRPEEADAMVAEGGHAAETLHVTLCYLGETEGSLHDVAAALASVANWHAPLTGVVAGFGMFAGGDTWPCVLLPDVPGLVELRVDVSEALVAAGVPYSRDHGFLAHLTLDYRAEGETGDVFRPDHPGQPVTFDAIEVVRGDRVEHRIPLVGAPALTAAGIEGRSSFCLPAALRGITDPVRVTVARTIADATVRGVKVGGLSFDVVNPLIDAALARVGSQITEISRTTQADVMRVIDAAYRQGLSIPDTAKAIRAHMDGAAPARARLIARTELAGAVNYGSLTAARLVEGATGERLYKEWMTAGGARYPRHATYAGLNGQTVPLDGVFAVGGARLDHPGDPSGLASEVCNCRCTMSYRHDLPPGADDLVAAAIEEGFLDRLTAAVTAPIPSGLAVVAAADAPADWIAPTPAEVLPIDCEHPVADLEPVVDGLDVDALLVP